MPVDLSALVPLLANGQDLLLDLLLAIPGQHGGAHYQVSWQILNCRKHGGLPPPSERRRP